MSADHPLHLLSIDINRYWMLECYPGLSYYRDRRVHFAMCAGNELFYAMLYLSYFTSGPFYLFYILAVLCFPVALLKSGIALLQGYLAATNLVGVDLKERQEMKKD